VPVLALYLRGGTSGSSRAAAEEGKETAQVV